MNSSRSKQVIYKLYLSILILLLAIGSGFILIGVPLTFYDRQMVKNAQKCFDSNFEPYSVTTQTADFNWNDFPVERPTRKEMIEYLENNEKVAKKPWEKYQKPKFDPDQYLKDKGENLLYFNKYGTFQGPKYIEDKMAEACGIRLLTLVDNESGKPKMKLYSSRVIIDSDPSLAVPLYIGMFFYASAGLLLLARRWTAWLLKP